MQTTVARRSDRVQARRWGTDCLMIVIRRTPRASPGTGSSMSTATAVVARGRRGFRSHASALISTGLDSGEGSSCHGDDRWSPPSSPRMPGS